MDNSENLPAPGSEPNPDQFAGLDQISVRDQLESLRHLIISVLVVVFILAGAFDLFLYRLVSNTRKERDAMNAAIAEYNKTTAPAMSDFVKKLNDFGKTHPDFNALLSRYGLLGQPGATNRASAATATAVPAPASPVSKKK